MTSRRPRRVWSIAASTAVRLLLLPAFHVVVATASRYYDDDGSVTPAGESDTDDGMQYLMHPFAVTDGGVWYDNFGGLLADSDGAFYSPSTDVEAFGARLFLNGSLPCFTGGRGRLAGDQVTADPSALFCNGSAGPGDDEVLLVGNYWALILLVFPVLTVFGNVLVVMSVYRERSLQSVTNYFIVSLAIADIMVAILVMPLAVYVEVNNAIWELGDALCDTWVALDVMCCTASILNLAAIGVDRFFAVTQPIKYAKHKNSNRVYAMLGLTWVISITISSPIALGMNYTDRRSMTPTLCTFYNSDFLIYSSMGSFYIPCIVMTLLYWRIFHAIRQRARKSKAASAATSLATNLQHQQQQQKRSGGCRSSAQPSAAEPEVIIVNRSSPVRPASPPSQAAVTRLDVPPAAPAPLSASETDDNCSTPHHQLLLAPRRQQQQQVGFNHVVHCHVTTNCVAREDDDDEDEGTGVDGGNNSGDGGDSSAATKDAAPDRIQCSAPAGCGPENGGGRLRGGGYHAPTTVVVESCTGDEFDFGEPPASYLAKRQQQHHNNTAATATLPVSKLSVASMAASGGIRDGGSANKQRNGSGHIEEPARRVGVSVAKKPTNVADGRKTFVTKFNFRLKKTVGKTADKQKQRLGGAHNAHRRERKATKTLAIVLGVFLLCWVPFFTINIINAICIRYNLFDNYSVCQIDPMLFSFFVWLGYMNSFLNPVIYTIFNMEFRRAFKKILQNPCGK